MSQRNNRGTSAEPWGTPDVTGAASDRVPSIMTLCVRLVRKSPIQDSVGPLTP